MATVDAATDYPHLDLPDHFVQSATQAADWVLVWPVALTLVGAGLLVMLREHRTMQVGFAALITLGVVVSNIYLLVRVFEEGPIAMTMGKWLPPFGITFAADMTSALFCLAASVSTLVVILFAQVEVDDREHRFGFYPLVLLLLCGVCGSFLTGDIFNLYVWFEVMLISSFGLLILGGRKIQLDGAVKYGFLNLLATTFFLVAIAYTYGLTGSLNMADIAQKAGDIPVGSMVSVAALFFLAFAIKAAAFPANAWLPASYHTPTVSVSALFGGMLTKVGAYAIYRLLLVVLPEGRDFLESAILAVAVATMILGPLGALAQTNIRRAVGFLVIGGIGVLFAGLTIGTMHGIGGGVIYAMHSILTLTALYLVCGLIERMSGTTDIRFMGGIYGANAPMSVAFIILVFAVAGLPPFLGFWPKLLLVEGGIRIGDWLVVAALLLNSLLTLIAASRLWAHIFLRNGHEGEHSEQENKDLRKFTPVENAMGLVPTLVLIAIIVGMGLFPNWIFDAGGMAAMDMLSPDRYIDAVFAEVPQP